MVKNITAITLAFFLGPIGNMQAATAHELFRGAQRLYDEGKFEDSLLLYAKIENKGAGTWCNMAACYYALHNYPLAIVSCTRAQKGAPSPLLESIERIMQASYTNLNYRDAPFEQFSAFERWALSFSPLFIQILFLISWYTCWFFIIRRRIIFFPVVLAAFLCLLMLFGSMLLVHYYAYVYKKGMTVKESRLVAGPHDQYDLLREIPLLKEVQIKERRDGWYKVTTDNHTGWLREDSVEIV